MPRAPGSINKKGALSEEERIARKAAGRKPTSKENHDRNNEKR